MARLPGGPGQHPAHLPPSPPRSLVRRVQLREGEGAAAVRALKTHPSDSLRKRPVPAQGRRGQSKGSWAAATRDARGERGGQAASGEEWARGCVRQCRSLGPSGRSCPCPAASISSLSHRFAQASGVWGTCSRWGSPPISPKPTWPHQGSCLWGSRAWGSRTWPWSPGT